MSESQKNIIENLIKEKGKTKRELAKLLKIQENNINRTLKNPNISILKLRTIANFLEVDVIDIISKGGPARDSGGNYVSVNPLDAANQLTISNLSDALNRSSKTIENLVQIVADSYTGKKSVD